MFVLPESWVWDFWLAHDGRRHHLFFLYASRALHDPDARHYRASIGHAVSDDLRHWTRVQDALVREDAPAWDDLATWTGSVVRGDDGLWWMFFTGSTRAEGTKNIQSIGAATSPDLVTWTRAASNPLLRADPRHYELLADGQWRDEAFRDPWVLHTDGGWHMLITARANHGPADDRGVIGHATSLDLKRWTLQAPLTQPGQGFGHLEVPQVECVDGQWLLLFSCLGVDLAQRNRDAGRKGGVWVATASGPLGPYDLENAAPVLGEEQYSGRLVRHGGQWMLLAFRHEDAAGGFVGEIGDPVPVHWDGERLVIGVPLRAAG